MNVDRDFLDCCAALCALTDVQRERWVDLRIVGIPCEQIANRDGVTKSCVWLSVQKADELLVGHLAVAA